VREEIEPRLALRVAKALKAQCGSPRRVVVEPSEVAGLKGDTWHVTGEPTAAAAVAEDPTSTSPLIPSTSPPTAAP